MRIAEFAKSTGLSPDTLRYYEKIGLIGPVLRDQAGHRIYREADRLWVGFLQRLRATGMPISGMLAYARLRAQGDHTAAPRCDMLIAHRAQVAAQIAELSDCLSVLDTKIATYRAMIDNDGEMHDRDETGTRPAAAE